MSAGTNKSKYPAPGKALVSFQGVVSVFRFVRVDSPHIETAMSQSAFTERDGYIIRKTVDMMTHSVYWNSDT